jgi:hypothetical protein
VEFSFEVGVDLLVSIGVEEIINMSDPLDVSFLGIGRMLFSEPA